MFLVDIISSESEAVKDAVAAVPFEVSCEHTNMSPPLSTKSLVLSDFYPSSLTGEVLNHWLHIKLLNRMEYIGSL